MVLKTWIIKGKGQHGGTVQITIANTLTAEQMVDRILSGDFGTFRGFVTLQHTYSNTVIPVMF